MYTLYVNNDCGFCKIEEKYLSLNNVNFNKVDINSLEESNSIKKMGYVPVLEINEDLIVGFQKHKIDEMLNITPCSRRIYMDYAATTPIRQECLEHLVNVYNLNWANPSSLHMEGNNSNELLEAARKSVADVFNCKPTEVYFTGGGSESNNMAIKGIAFANMDNGNHIITSSIEHKSVLETCNYLKKNGFEVTYLPVNKNGIVDVEALESSIKSDTILISIMFANNEIGSVQNISDISQIAHKHNILLHVDGVQTVGHIPINVKTLGIDAFSASAHKFYGPKGTGFLYAKENVKFNGLIHGGGQENYKRAGTENLPNIYSMVKALELSYSEMNKNEKSLKILREYFIDRLSKEIENIKINGSPNAVLNNILSVTFYKNEEYDLSTLLDIYGIAVSVASACAQDSVSHVLTAIGLSDEECRNTIRFSLSVKNTKEEIDYVIDVLKHILYEKH